jgi:hypothetical protein
VGRDSQFVVEPFVQPSASGSPRCRRSLSAAEAFPAAVSVCLMRRAAASGFSQRVFSPVRP